MKPYYTPKQIQDYIKREMIIVIIENPPYEIKKLPIHPNPADGSGSNPK